MWGHQSSGARAPELWCPLSSWLKKAKLFETWVTSDNHSGKPPQIQDGGNGEKLRRLVKISWIRMRRPLTIDVNASLWIFQRFMIQVFYLYFIIWHTAVSSAVCDWIIFWPLMIIWPSPLRPTKEITTGLNWTDTGLLHYTAASFPPCLQMSKLQQLDIRCKSWLWIFSPGVISR